MLKKLLLAVVLGVTSLAGVPGVTAPAQASASEYGWCYYGSYGCYCNAQNAARYLRGCGYCTYISCSGSCYRVYYH